MVAAAGRQERSDRGNSTGRRLVTLAICVPIVTTLGGGSTQVAGK